MESMPNMVSWSSLSIFLLITLFTWGILKYVNMLYFWRKRGVSGPTPLPFVGNMWRMTKTGMETIDVEDLKKYGRIYGVFEGDKPVLFVSDPALIKSILVRDFDVFTNRRDFGNLEPLFEDMLSVARDARWKRIRTIVTPTFSSGKLRRMAPAINECVQAAMEHLSDVTKTDEKVEMKTFWGCYTVDVIAKCCFATEINAHKDPNSIFMQNVTSFFKPRAKRLILSQILPKGTAKFLKKLNITISMRNDALIYFKDLVDHLSKERRANPKAYDDFLALLMEAQEEQGESNHRGLTDNEVLAQTILFFVAGYETTASLISFACYLMALNPKVQETLYDELSSAKHAGDGEIIYDTLMKLPYLDAVVNETLRYYSPGIRLEREVSREYRLGETGITLPKNSIISVPVHALHHEKEFFPDPEDYRPERFLNPDDIVPYSFLPFGSGPRNCVAIRFALFEAKWAICTAVLNFKFERIAETVFPPVFPPGQALASAKSLIVGVKKR